ncbi:bifunctional diguanylate cyclase/phosphodiesterase [Lysobacter helvus]|uniref:Bifunctional diguanylate cyclase/phosphodiesterase n=2 Tax=Lysobacteraceae TaxID=32033 RepID=A0ABN6FRB4_9GAMM|nr:bifunctional diguanylate cyclase/phosphodiesterase [Lysobacter caseinilyticus]BCT95097.1 bifunctional diguanylate cyclase/phosphodiesterase [Lysobacter helvus]
MPAALLGARAPAEAIAAWFAQAPHLPAMGACVLWSTHWPRDVRAWPEGPVDPGVLARAIDAVARSRAGVNDAANPRVLHDDGEDAVAVLHCPAGPVDADPALRLRLAELLGMQQMQESVARLEQAEKLQRSLYAIADMAGSDLDMPDMLRGLHRIVSDLMYAENFYIALYDRERDALRFLYFADVVDDQDKLLPDEEVPLAHFERGLTWYLVRDKRPLMGATEDLQKQVSGPLRLHGADSSDWLGVPMLREGEVHGVVVVQSYTGDRCYTTAEMSLLAFVAEHILTALERKRGRAELEQHVVERTQQLQVANSELRREVGERERGERLQAALYRIAALASLDETSDGFYRHVHAIVGELIDARNFYIGLLSEDGMVVSFPYAADEFERDWSARSFGRGLTEFVLQTGRPQLVKRPDAMDMITAGLLDPAMMGAPTQVWLGAPLLSTEGAIGVVAVQSYESSTAYDERDAELLTFVSYQIGSSLQRRRAAELLRQANAELETRVEERTVELREQIQVRQHIEAQLQHQVMHDALTGLPNRIYLRDRIERAIGGLRRDVQWGFGLLYIDVDRFKVVNDSLGHSAGDALLKEVASRLSGCVREPDVVARMAGDEFVMLLEHVQQPETACKVAQRVLRALQPTLQVAGRDLQLSASIGIAIADAGCESADRILHDADTALYRAKTAGRNRFVLFDDAMHQTAMGVLDLEQALRDALLRDEFEPWFQPIVRLDDDSVVGYEALLRWRSASRGVLRPGEFMKVAEDSGLIEPIDWRMFRLALQAGRALVAPRGDGVQRYITLNVSPRLFQHNDFDRRLLDLVAENGFDPAALRLEVTEGTLLGDPEAMVATLHRLREAGVEAALDDFGTGYSSLGHVHRFPLRMIKIDQSFVAPFANGESPRSSAVIEAILALGNALGVEIVAEGIETAAQHDVLKRMGCTYGQGYRFAAPQPASHWLG